jgi:hypothetical protein
MRDELTLTAIIYLRKPRDSEGDTRALQGATGCSYSLCTITTKKTRHLSQPPSQHTRQSSIRSPSDTGLQSLRNFV